MTWTPESIKSMLETFGLPVSCGPFPDDDAGPHAPAPPFLLYDIQKEPFFADDEAFCGLSYLLVEMYTRSREFEREKALEALLRENGLTWNAGADWLKKQKLYVVSYQMGVILDGGDA